MLKYINTYKCNSVRQTTLTQDQRTLLIQNVSKYPSLYKNEYLRKPYLNRQEKQQMWEEIAKESGYDKIEDAKLKWRCLTNYLRQHLDNVAQKKLRRYIPKTGKHEDKFVQLTDWRYYKEMEFIVPYIKYAANKRSFSGNHMDISASEMEIKLQELHTEAYITTDSEQKQTCETDVKHQQTNNLITPDKADDLSEGDEILKDFFENMLRSTQKLSKFHQNRIREKLLECINEQKLLNKIN